ncbi:MAG: aminoglycoside phosphotransferase [Planctomycetes bacterium]|nr:aminoglycoside phosphotransferase [Planctomycetota bacterium]
MVDSISDQRFEVSLQLAAASLGFVIEGGPSYGWRHKSVGVRVRSLEGEIKWMRLTYTSRGVADSRLFYGYRDAQSILGVKKPDLEGSTEWENEGFIWRADVMTYVAEPMCSSTPDLRTSVTLDNDWWKSLRTSLDHLGRTSTYRVCVRQDLVTRRLSERFGESLDSVVRNWVVSHGDIHWANLTSNSCWILDWEGWGLAPAGTDAAFLICFSAAKPPIVERIRSVFGHVLDTPDGRLAQLFACAELLRMIELYGDHPHLETPLWEIAHSLL